MTAGGGASWFAEHKHRLPTTRTHRTRGGGLHLVFQHEAGLRCSAGKIAAGIDVRANGGYVIWWPAAGWPVLCEASKAPWPECYGIARLVQLVASAREGERNNLAYWGASRADEMVASGLLGAATAAEVIAEAATRAGLPRSEAERTAWSGIRATGGFACA